MQDRRQQKLGWTLGWLGGFIWVFILAVVFLVQGKILAAVLGFVLVAAAVAVIALFAPWRHPHTMYRQLMVPTYALVFVAVAWGVWGGGDLRQMGINSPWSALLLMPVLMPLWTVGKRRWTDGEE